MCELFGACSNEALERNELLDTFFSHSDIHGDGWGIATYMGRGGVSLEKEPLAAKDSVYLKNRLSVPVREKVLIAHIRRASIGSIEYLNCHPFVMEDKSGRCWTLIHNGTLFTEEKTEKYKLTQRGACDSERILCYLIDRLDDQIDELGREPSEKERIKRVDDAIAELAPNNKLNLIIYDGDVFYAHSNLADTLHMLIKEDSVIFSTKSLTDEAWEAVPLAVLFAYKSGREVYRGEDRGTTFVEKDAEKNKEYIKPVENKAIR